MKQSRNHDDSKMKSVVTDMYKNSDPIVCIYNTIGERRKSRGKQKGAKNPISNQRKAETVPARVHIRQSRTSRERSTESNTGQYKTFPIVAAISCSKGARKEGKALKVTHTGQAIMYSVAGSKSDPKAYSERRIQHPELPV